MLPVHFHLPVTEKSIAFTIGTRLRPDFVTRQYKHLRITSSFGPRSRGLETNVLKNCDVLESSYIVRIDAHKRVWSLLCYMYSCLIVMRKVSYELAHDAAIYTGMKSFCRACA